MFTQRLKGIYRTIGTLIILLFVMIGNVSHSRAQQAYFWSPQERIPDYEINNKEQPPYLIADQNHVVHAFNTQSLEMSDENAPTAIFYRQWTLENGWTYPNDILFDASGGSIDLIGVSSDQTGLVHLVFQKNFDAIYYTSAVLANAHDPSAWSTPVYIAGKSLHIRPGIPIIGAIANDSISSGIVTIFGGSQYGNGLYYSISLDQGSSWTEPYPVYLTGSRSLIVSDTKLFMGKLGILHTVWATIREDGFGGPAYYASFDLKDNTWSDPVELDLPDIQTPAIIESGDNVFVGYYRQDGNQNWWRRVLDQEKSWSFPSRISEQHIGRNGAMSFVEDSGGVLHVFFAERTKDNIHGMWHSVWTGTTWTVPESVVEGPRIIDEVGGNGFDPNSARAVISNGNVALVTWGTDGGAGSNGAWYSYKILNTPELPSQPLILPTSDIDNNKSPIATSVFTEKTPAVVVDVNNDHREYLQNPQFPIIIGGIPVFLVLIGFILLRLYLRSKNP